MDSADPADAPDILDPSALPNLLSTAFQSSVDGIIFNRSSGSGDVDWFRFDLPSAALVTLEQAAGSLVSVISLFNTTEPFNSETLQGDRYELIGHRLLEQAAGGAGAVSITRALAPGTYYVAVSGEGNRHFHPLIAESGYPGQLGDYTLQITAVDLQLNPADGPAVLAVEPAAAAALAAAPPVVRVSLSAPLDPAAIVRLRGPDGEVPLEWTNFSPQASELQLAPARALMPGTYQVVLIDGVAETELAAFQVEGWEGSPGAAGADDYPGDVGDEPGGAHDLGDVLSGELIQRTGFIGDDPAYDPASGDLYLSNPAADVDLYHFQITSEGRYALMVEVFAGRVGSPLNPGVSLFRLNEETGWLELVAVNDNTFVNMHAADGTQPLLSDSLLYAGLTPGHYYLAVSSSGPIGFANVPDPAHGLLPGDGSIFDPNYSHSGLNGTTRGKYVLNLVVVADPDAPQVVSATPPEGAVLDVSPTQLLVQFSEAVNLPLLASRAFLASFPFPPEPASAYIVCDDSSVYYLSLRSYDAATNTAVFLLPAGLPNGSYQLRLAGVTDLAGNPLAGAGPDGVFRIPFMVDDPNPVEPPPPQADLEPNDDPFQAQPLGTLSFPGIVVQGTLSVDQETGVIDALDFFAFDVPETDGYVFTLSRLDGAPLPQGFLLLITDSFGIPVAAITNLLGGGIAVIAQRLAPGSYLAMVGFAAPEQVENLTYRLQMARAALPENPPPLTNSPAPAAGLRLAGRFQAPPPPPPQAPPPPQVIADDTDSGSSTGGATGGSGGTGTSTGGGSSTASNNSSQPSGSTGAGGSTNASMIPAITTNPGTGIIPGGPAGAGNGDGARRAAADTGNAFFAFATFGPDSLSFLSAGPLGASSGVTDTATLAGSDRLQLTNGSPALLTALIRLTLLTPHSPGETSEEGLAPEDDPDRDAVELMQRSWAHLLDSLFRSGGWLPQLTAPASPVRSEIIEIEPEEALSEIEPSAWDCLPAGDLETGMSWDGASVSGYEAGGDLIEAGGGGAAWIGTGEDPGALDDDAVPPWAWASALAVAALFPPREGKRNRTRNDFGPASGARGWRRPGEEE